MARAAEDKAKADLARDYALGHKGASSRQFEANSRRRPEAATAGAGAASASSSSSSSSSAAAAAAAAAAGAQAEEEDEETLFERELTARALARGAKRCPQPPKTCAGGLLVHYRGHGRHDVSCSLCAAQACFLCGASWAPYSPRCACDNACSEACQLCPVCPDCTPRDKCTMAKVLEE